MCNVASCIEEQALMFARLSYAANQDTPDGAEWKRLSSVMDEQRAVHYGKCTRCRAERGRK